jgi:hypothetical protein
MSKANETKKIETAVLADALNIVLGKRPGTFCPGDIIGAEDIEAARDEAADFIRKFRREIPADLTAFEFNKAQCSSQAYVRGWQISIDEAREHIAAARLVEKECGPVKHGW